MEIVSGRQESVERKLVAIRIADYDPAAKAPVLFGDPAGDVLMADGDLILAAGEVGAGKSITAADAALAAAFGQPLLGFPCPKQRKVILVLADGDGEMPSRRRIFRLGAGRELTPEQIDTCGRFVLFVPSAFSLDDPADFRELKRELADFDPDFVGIESIASLMGPKRDPYNQADAADFMGRRLRPLQVRPDDTRRTMLVGAHLIKMRSGKAGKRLKDRVATSFYTLGSVDAAIGLDAVEDERFVVRMVKRTRWGCAFAPFLVIVRGQKDEPLSLFNAGIVGDDAKERRRPAIETAVKIIEKAQETAPDLTRAAAVKLCVAAQVTRSTAYRACDNMGIA